MQISLSFCASLRSVWALPLTLDADKQRKDYRNTNFKLHKFCLRFLSDHCRNTTLDFRECSESLTNQVSQGILTVARLCSYILLLHSELTSISRGELRPLFRVNCPQYLGREGYFHDKLEKPLPHHHQHRDGFEPTTSRPSHQMVGETPFGPLGPPLRSYILVVKCGQSWTL